MRYTDDLSGTAVLPEDVLLAWDGANAGTIGFGKSGYIGSTIARLRISKEERIYTPFLGTFLKSKFDYLRQTATGATIPHISRKALDDIELPDVDFDDQVRIARLLGKVEGLIDQRKQHLKQLDDLLKGVFLEKFGDPIRNLKGWDRDKLGKLTVEKIGYGIVQPGTPVENGVPVIRVGDFAGTKIDTTNITKVAAHISKKHQNTILKGDEILLACVGSTIGKVAAVEAIHAGYNIVRATARIRTSPRINRLFLLHFLLSDFSQNYYIKVTRSVGQPTLNIKQIEELEVYVPDIDAQNQFAAIVEKVESIKSRYQQSLTDLEALFNALSQQAFKGELDLSSVPLTDMNPVEEKTVVIDLLHPPTEESVAINLPESDILLDALENEVARRTLITQWLEAYRVQLSDTPFSVQRFMAAARTRIAELHADDNFELDVSDYDHIKNWVFEALANGDLQQSRDITGNDESGKPIFGNLIEVKSGARP